METQLASSLAALRNGEYISQARRLSTSVPGGVFRRYSNDINTIQRISDSLFAGLSLWGVSTALDKPWNHLEQAVSLFAVMLVAVTAKHLGIYTSFRNGSHWTLLRRVCTLWLCLIGGVSLGIFIFKIGSQISREQILAWFGGYGCYLGTSHLASRQLLRQLRLHGRNTRCDGYIGSEEGLSRIQQDLDNAGWLGHRVRAELCWPEHRLPSKQQLNDLRCKIDKHQPDQWLVEEPADPTILSELLECLKDQTAPVLLIPRWLDEEYYQPRYCQLGSIGAFELWGHSEQATPLQLRIKHCVDRTASALILLMISPLIAVIAIAVKLDSPGPILFKQCRYGLNGKPFTCLKFRTMTTLENDDRVVQATRNDPRVTRVGAILRRWNLDELPQLVNIWRGEMSLVGPRPHAAAHNDYYRSRIKSYMRRHSLKPGLTGWAQVLGLRGETETIEKMEARVDADIQYIQNWSLKLDIKIFLLTFARWRNKNAY